MNPCLRRPALLSIFLAVFALIFLVLPARAQDRIWLQIEAQPTLDEAISRAGAYAGAFPNVVGYRLTSGWFAIVLGPYGVAEGAAALTALKSENLIPPDSFIVDGAKFTTPYFPEGAPAADAAGTAAVAPESVAPAPVTPEAALPDPEPEPPVAEPEETQREAFASEAALSPEDKRLLQVALRWFGYYKGAIDGAYGPGTRGAMAAWQKDLGLDATGVLTSRQRATLVANYEAERAEFGFETVEDGPAGISVTLPLALVEFDRYDPPFAHYTAKNGSGLSIVLISQPGDQAAFGGLYELLQTLEAIPASGDRQKGKSEFTIHGISAAHEAHVRVGLKNGLVKGWMLFSTPATAERDARVMEVLEQSFTPMAETALDLASAMPLDEAARRGLISGLAVKKPLFSRSGFYVSDRGDVLTTQEAVESCGKITLERQWQATVLQADPETGLAVLRPQVPLAPPVVAAFATASPLAGTSIAIAGYPYEARLPSPVLTYGMLEELGGLDGETGVARLSVAARAGDAGGPVLDGSGAVLGMLLPAEATAGRQLPPDVAFAADAASIAALLGRAGIAARTTTETASLPPETLTRRATGMTVLVSCWE
jgi:hypothetical protein